MALAVISRLKMNTFTLLLFATAIRYAAEARHPIKSLNLVMHLKGGIGSGGDVIHPRDQIEFEDILNADPETLIVIDFGATWCGPCRQIESQYEQLASSYAPVLEPTDGSTTPSVLFVSVDVDELRDAAEAFEVSALPTFVFIKNKTTLTRFSGASIQKLRETVESHI